MTFSREDTKAVKGMAVLFMLYHHLFAFPSRIPEGITYVALFDIAGKDIAYWIGAFGKLCVMLFVFLGGYGIFFSGKTQPDVTKLLKSKIGKLYRVYWQVFFLFIPICMLFHAEQVTKNLADFIWNFSGLKITYNKEWWFYTPYLFLLAAFPLLKKIIREKSGFFTNLTILCFLNFSVLYLLPIIKKMEWTSKISGSLFWKILLSALGLLPSFLMGYFCARFDVFSKLKQRFSGNYLYCFFSLLVLLLVFYMRKKTGSWYDWIYAPVFAISLILALQNKIGAFFYFILRKIGEEGTVIWLTHTFFCYMLCPEVIYFPRYAVLIVAWLTLICFLTAKAMHKLYGLLGKGYSFVKNQPFFQNPFRQ